ncbi:MAG: hypothetical protein K0Q90_102 [Paenibacillaceae bacterium]|jgi:hypothetical protein|nr:hypothetical protein [Paenibacillaceae bacterium]
MTRERLILIAGWIIVTAAALLLLNRTNWRRFAAGYLMAQNVTWLNVLIHCRLGMFTYPVREFPKATDAGFTLQYLVYPAVCGFCILFEPSGPFWKKGLYTLAWPTAVVIFRIILMRYTRLIAAYHYNLLLDWSTVVVLFLISIGVTKWIFRSPAYLQSEERIA